MTMSLRLGETARISAEFVQQSTGLDIDPTSPLVKVRDPLGVVTVYASPTRDSLGNYHQDVSIPRDSHYAGTWYYWWEGTGTNQSTDEEFFVVDGSLFY